MNTQLTELLRLLRNMIRTGVITDVDADKWLCRVASGELKTDWIPWLTMRAGASRTWWKPSAGEQVLLLAIGGELTTAFALPAIYSDENPPPSNSQDGWVVTFPDGARFEYEPESGHLSVSGIKSLSMAAAESMELVTKQLTIDAEHTQINGEVSQSGGAMSSNGVVVHEHVHIEVQAGKDNSGGPK
ncbi:phage baseplate assembly protein V [Plesiomonas shigelloides]|uniref:phage baseplate assembly protein V n=1 Tax=Plesiomonas shigelloides TaxID=703 RepID=UPI001261A58A|nr:phage baseplate assembly protein V [Plesiomonas shigelloides]KAB7685671.1 phage baseplate assembly protein V [Plesiomonas shigelloides]